MSCARTEEKSPIPAPIKPEQADSNADDYPENEEDAGSGRLDECMAQLQKLANSNATAELARYYEGLPLIVVTSKIVPVFYLRKPERDPDSDALKIANELAESKRIYHDVSSVLAKFSDDKPFLRKIFLREGYLFEDSPYVARALVRQISVRDLFDEPFIFRYRNNGVEKLDRVKDEYVDSDGDQAKLLLNDRLALIPDGLDPPLHLDLGVVRAITGAQRTLQRVVDERAAWLDLVFPDGEKRSALVKLENGGTVVSCISGDQETLEQTMVKARAFWERHGKIVAAAEKMVEERARFDEPIDEAEDVQEDGDLRLEWMKAYMRRQKTFKLREVEYKVFDYRGNPIPPEVCVDFVFDVWERGSGTWFKPRGKRPGRTEGEIDFLKVPGLARRHIPSILQFAADENTPLERYDIPRKDWAPLKKLSKLAAALARHTHAIREGDALIIHGLREQDMEEHFHSVLVLATDPLTGMPMEVGDNQGRPRIGTLNLAMLAAPLRSVKYRLRLHFEEMKEYLERINNPDAGENP